MACTFAHDIFEMIAMIAEVRTPCWWSDQDAARRLTTENDIKCFANSLQKVWRYAKSSKEFAKSLNMNCKEARKHFLLAQKIEFDQITRKQFNIVLKDGVIWSNIRTLCKLFGTLCMKLFARLQTICKEFANNLISFSVVR